MNGWAATPMPRLQTSWWCATRTCGRARADARARSWPSWARPAAAARSREAVAFASFENMQRDGAAAHVLAVRRPHGGARPQQPAVVQGAPRQGRRLARPFHEGEVARIEQQIAERAVAGVRLRRPRPSRRPASADREHRAVSGMSRPASAARRTSPPQATVEPGREANACSSTPTTARWSARWSRSTRSSATAATPTQFDVRIIDTKDHPVPARPRGPALSARRRAARSG